MTSGAASTGTLALIGGGEFEPSCKSIDSALLEASGATEVLVIPAASAFESPDAIVQRATAYFAKLGAKVTAIEVTTRRDANDDATVRAVKGAKFIYLTDGSPMHLRSVLKDTQLFDVIVGAYRRGAVLAASGAGATVLCDPMVDPRGGAYTVGLGVVANVAFFAHHTSAADHIWDRATELLPREATLIGVDDHTALIRSSGGQWQVLGSGTAVTQRVGAKPKTHRKGALTLP